MNLITCRNVSLSYEGKKVIRNLSFGVESGDYLCIVGENGAGKSTLAKGLLNIIRPSEGSILMENGLTPGDIGYLPQQTAIQKDFPASVYEIVLSGRLNRLGFKPFYSREDRRTADENIEKLGLSPVRNRCYRELSGGMQQRVLLARALCAAGKVILLDEPTSSLDPIVSQEFYGLIERLNRDGVTVIMISHDIAASAAYAKHILHLHRAPLFFGTAKDYMQSDIGRRFAGKDGDVQPGD